MMQNYNKITNDSFEPPVSRAKINRAQATIRHATDSGDISTSTKSTEIGRQLSIENINFTSCTSDTTGAKRRVAPLSNDCDSALHVGNGELVLKRSRNLSNCIYNSSHSKIDAINDNRIGESNQDYCIKKNKISVGGGTSSTISSTCASAMTKKSRRSFTIQQKIDFVKEYKNYCQLQQQKQKQMEDQKQSNDIPSDGGNDDCSANQDTAKSMASWLRRKEENDGISIARSTFSRWYQSFGKDEEDKKNNGNDQTHRHKRRRRIRPFHEMESILIEILKVRNARLRSQNKPISTTVFIRNRAEMIYKDLYGEEAATFKCSNGWLSRFLEHYQDVLNPGANNTDTRKQEQQHYLTKKQQPYDIGNNDNLGMGMINANHDNILLHHPQQQEHYHHTLDVVPTEMYHHSQQTKDRDRESEQQFLSENSEI